MLQILRYVNPLESTPYFKLEEKGEELLYRIEGEINIEVAYVGCIGYFDGKRHHKCPNGAINVRQCPTCKARDISRIYTSFDFTGYEELRAEREEKEYSVYLTTFGEIVKAGVTEAERLERRIYEQGGGYYVELARLKGKKAYDLEYILHHTFGIKGAVYKKEKLLAYKKPDELGLEKMKEIIEELKGKIEWIDGGNIRRHIYNVPKSYELAEGLNVEGEVVGIRGPALFVDVGEKVVAINAREYIGYFVKRIGGFS